MNNYQNFFVQTVTRSLQTAYDSLTPDSALSNDIRDRALTAIDLAFRPQIAIESWLKTRELILMLSPKMEQAGHWDDWQPYLQQALTVSQMAEDIRSEAAIGIQIGIFLQRQGQQEIAIQWFLTSIERAKVVDDRIIWTSALNRLGFTASVQHKVTEASAYIEHAFELMAEDDPQREYSYMVLGNVALSMQEPQNAANYFQLAVDICRQNGDNRRMAICLNNLGVALHHQGMHQAALATYEDAIVLWLALNDPVEMAITEMNQGLICESLGDLQTALSYYRKSKVILEKAQNSNNLAKLYNNQGYCYYKLQRWQDAEEMYQASLTELRPLECWVNYANVLDGLGSVYHEQSRWEEAIRTFRKALQILSETADKYVSAYLFQEIQEHLEKSYAAAVGNDKDVPILVGPYRTV